MPKIYLFSSILFITANIHITVHSTSNLDFHLFFFFFFHSQTLLILVPFETPIIPIIF